MLGFFHQLNIEVTKDHSHIFHLLSLLFTLVKKLIDGLRVPQAALGVWLSSCS
jgi:hypothetical protein